MLNEMERKGRDENGFARAFGGDGGMCDVGVLGKFHLYWKIVRVQAVN